MRVLILTNLYPRPWQPARAPWNRAQYQQLGGLHEARLISPVSWTDLWRARMVGQRLSILCSWARDGSLEICYAPYFFVPRLWLAAHGRFMLRSVAPLAKHLLGPWRPDVLLASWAYPDGWVGVELGKQLGCPVAVKVHGSDVLRLERHPHLAEPTARALRSADAVIAISRHLSEAVGRLGVSPEQIHLVPNGVDQGIFHRPSHGGPAPDEGRLDILFVGNLEPVKGLDVLLEACAILQARGLPFRLRVVGGGPRFGRYRRLARRLALGPRVMFVGTMPQEQLAAEYWAASVVAMPSRWEGRPNVLLEAAACGARSVATRVGGIPELQPLTNSLLVPHNDPRALADGIVEVWRNPKPFEPSLNAARRGHAESAQALAEVLVRVVGEWLTPRRTVMGSVCHLRSTPRP